MQGKLCLNVRCAKLCVDWKFKMVYNKKIFHDEQQLKAWLNSRSYDSNLYFILSPSNSLFLFSIKNKERNISFILFALKWNLL